MPPIAGIVSALLLVISSLSSASPSTASTAAKPTVKSLIAPGAKIKVVARGLKFAEGPLWLPDGRLIVSSVEGNVVWAFDAAGKKSVFRRPSNTANGHALAPDGSVVEAEAGDGTHRGAIVRISPDGSVMVLADSFHGKRFNEPNDVIVGRDGTIWFTDPSFNGTATSAIGFYGVYRLDPKTKAVTLVTKMLSAPNGIAFSPDQKTLYVSDTGDSATVRFRVAANDTVGPAREFGAGCDGIGVDEHGNVWKAMCDQTIAITDPAGKRIGAITFPDATTSNLAWGGRDGKTLFVTTGEGVLYSLALTVREAH
jgi:gluconolactonase